MQRRKIRELWPSLTSHLDFAPQIPHQSTIWRWWEKLEEYGWDARALLDQNWKKGRKKLELEGVAYDLVEEAVEDEYLTMLRRTKEDAYKAVCNLFDSWNAANSHRPKLSYPSKKRVFGYIDGIDEFDKYAARYGHENAIRKYRSVKGSIVATRPLERVELDHTVADIIVLDDKTLAVLGRPTIAIAVDVFTRCIVGVYLGFEPPSSSTVAQCLRSAFLPKSLLLEAYPQIKGSWDVYGQMETLVLDQALENHANQIERMGGTLGIELAWCGSKMPWQKPYVERLIRTISRQLFHIIEGTTRSNIADKGEYDAVGRAVCVFSALKAALYQWIVDTYLTRQHRSLQVSPIGMWRNSIHEEDIPLCVDTKVLDVAMRIPTKRRIFHYGIETNTYNKYNSDELQQLRREHGDKYEVLHYPNLSNLGSILVEDQKTGNRFYVPSLNPEYTNGMTIWQHKAIRKFAKDSDLNVTSFEGQLAAKIALEATIYEGMADCPLKVRVQKARMMQATKEEQLSQINASNNAIVPPPCENSRSSAVVDASDDDDEFEISAEIH